MEKTKLKLKIFKHSSQSTYKTLKLCEKFSFYQRILKIKTIQFFRFKKAFFKTQNLFVNIVVVIEKRRGQAVYFLFN